MAFSLEAVFGVDTTGVKTSIKALRKDLNDFVSDYAKLGAGIAVGAFAALSKGAMEYAGHLSDMAANLDINVESLQALESQHKRNGVSQEMLTKALEKTKSSVMAAAEGEEKSVAALEKLGLKAADLIKLPLDRQYEKIAVAAGQAEDQNAAFSAVAALLGEKVGPRLLGSMKELAEQGLDAVTESATEAGHVMKAETIAQLDAAGDAIDDFKKKATIAMGEIIVNFRSAEGLQLLGMQFLKVVGEFGAGIVDAIVEAGGMAKAVFVGTFRGVTNVLRDGLLDALSATATKFNEIIPDFLKERGFTINVAGLEALRSSGKSVADEITAAIAATEPSTFKKEVGEFWDKRIQDQKLIVDALNEKDFGKEAAVLRDAGRSAGAHIEKSAVAVAAAGESAGEAIADAGESAAAALRRAAQEAFDKSAKAMGISFRSGQDFVGASDEALAAIVQKNQQKALDFVNQKGGSTTPNTSNYFDLLEAGRLNAEADNARKELELRQGVRSAYASGGTSGVYRQFSDRDPIYLDRLIEQFAKQLPENQKTASSLDRIERGLVQRKIIPAL